MTDAKTRAAIEAAADERFDKTDNGDDGAANYGFTIGAKWGIDFERKRLAEMAGSLTKTICRQCLIGLLKNIHFHILYTLTLLNGNTSARPWLTRLGY